MKKQVDASSYTISRDTTGVGDLAVEALAMVDPPPYN